MSAILIDIINQACYALILCCAIVVAIGIIRLREIWKKTAKPYEEIRQEYLEGGEI